jgi:hypothetical protein
MIEAVRRMFEPRRAASSAVLSAIVDLERDEYSPPL